MQKIGLLNWKKGQYKISKWKHKGKIKNRKYHRLGNMWDTVKRSNISYFRILKGRSRMGRSNT